MSWESTQPQQRSLFVILNDRAAQHEGLRQMLDVLGAEGRRVEERLVGDIGEPTELAVEAARRGFDVVVSAGGDGTLNEVVTGVVRSGRRDLAIGVLPFGTANDFATHCRIMVDDLETAWECILTRVPTLIDVGKVNDRFFINVASGGYGAEASAETPDYLKHILGGLAYSLTGLVKMFESRTRKGTFRGQDFAWEGDVLLFAVSNGRMAGGGYLVAPQAVLNDGLFDVLIVPAPGLTEIPMAVEDMLRLGSYDTDYVMYFRTPWLRVEAPVDLHVNVDGEPTQDHSFRFAMLDYQLPMLLPPDAPVLQVADETRQLRRA